MTPYTWSVHGKYNIMIFQYGLSFVGARRPLLTGKRNGFFLKIDFLVKLNLTFSTSYCASRNSS